MDVERINQVEQWLFALNLPPLSEQESEILRQPEKKSQDEVFADLVYVCDKRYQYSTFWPDFAPIGYKHPKRMRPRSKIFAIGL